MASDILIVDDEADIRDLVAGILNDEGFTTRTARDSDSALAEIANRRPHLVFLDIWLQGSKLDGLQLLAQTLGLERVALLAGTDRIVHGTTVATNALLEHKGAKVGLLTTEGHRDVIEMREGLKDDRYNLRQPPPAQLVPRDRRLGVRDQPDAHRRAVPPRRARGRQPRRLLLRAGAQAVAAAPRGRGLTGAPFRPRD